MSLEKSLKNNLKIKKKNSKKLKGKELKAF